MTRRNSQAQDKSKEFITKKERAAAKVPLTKKEIARVMAEVQRLALSDLRSRVRVAQTWGLTEAGARNCVDRAIDEWNENG